MHNNIRGYFDLWGCVDNGIRNEVCIYMFRKSL